MLLVLFNWWGHWGEHTWSQKQLAYSHELAPGHDPAKIIQLPVYGCPLEVSCWPSCLYVVADAAFSIAQHYSSSKVLSSKAISLGYSIWASPQPSWFLDTNSAAMWNQRVSKRASFNKHTLDSCNVWGSETHRWKSQSPWIQRFHNLVVEIGKQTLPMHVTHAIIIGTNNT